MNDLQRFEFDILKAFVSVCEQLNLKYFLVCGSALGAAKYNGFIPWDDDIDVALTREDFNIFLKKAKRYLPQFYFIQTYFTDPNYPSIICKIRDSRTTFIETSMQNVSMNHGVYIDIFPLDGYPVKKSEIHRLEIKKKILELKLSSANYIHKEQKPLTRLFFRTERLLGFHRRTAKYAAKLEKLISKYPTAESPLWCNHGNWQGKLEYAPREQYGEGVFAEFEGLKVRIPEKFDEYLIQKYGNWRADLPVEEQQGHHTYTVCDLSRPYIDYC